MDAMASAPNPASDPTLTAEIGALCATARSCFARGWAPATSGNFSVRSGSHILITPTGLDKSQLAPADLLEIDPEGRVVAGRGKPSAETGLHTVIYREFATARAILHVHSIWNTLLLLEPLRAGAICADRRV